MVKTSAAAGCLIAQHCFRGEGARPQDGSELKFVAWWMGIFDASAPECTGLAMRLVTRTDAQVAAIIAQALAGASPGNGTFR